MLVLSRQWGEQVVINGGTPNEIRVKIVDIRGNKVRIGITAPKEITVHRQEVQEAIQRNSSVCGDH